MIPTLGVFDFPMTTQFWLIIRLQMLQYVFEAFLTESYTSELTVLHDNHSVQTHERSFVKNASLGSSAES